jgi:hypothetical protein
MMRAIKAWCLLRDQYAHVKPVEETFGGGAEFVYDSEWDADKLVEARPDVVVCVNDHTYEVAQCLLAARRAGIPSLVVQDGILEWRCQYENPRFGAGGAAPQHQPVMADKIACLGAQSARQIAAWGNQAKVEVTGMPRLDKMLAKGPQPCKQPGEKLLVMTAKKPWFTDEQREVTLRSLRDLKETLESQPQIEVVWRLTKDVSDILGVENRLSELSTGELSEVLYEVDGVVTTVSTTILESVLAGRPVAALDYHNVPRFVPTAWTISCAEQIEAVVGEILNPPANKLSFQRDCLADVLRCDGPAAGHVAELMEKMAEIASQQREQGLMLKLPADLLGVTGSSLPEAPASLEALYPGQEIFSEDDPVVLQSMLARANAEVTNLQRQLESQHIGYWISHLGNFFYKKFGRRY